MRDLERLTELWHGEGPNLNAGCGLPGTCLLPPFINFDIVRYESWDTKPHCIFEVGDVREIPYPDKHFDVIFTSELIEHFHYSDAVKVLKEFYRVLKPGGCLKSICPDFDWAVKIYMGLIQYKDYDQREGLLALKNGEYYGFMVNIERVPDKLPWGYPHCTARDLAVEAWKK